MVKWSRKCGREDFLVQFLLANFINKNMKTTEQKAVSLFKGSTQIRFIILWLIKNKMPGRENARGDLVQFVFNKP